ncbi:thiamine pyrophosphate-requiring protein [Pseudonocardia zijingensis]|uniref:Thiamine pyrophosphate-requiring protein n=1 Tax=Pseudonocardia zijingensis TaxID=153376 RepID=A0ABN1P654_9PSEU
MELRDAPTARLHPEGRAGPVAAPTSVVRTVAEAFLVRLRRRGVDRLFVNSGTDFAPIVEAYARRHESRLDLPDVVVCAHENLAVSMAHGSYLGDGRMQAVVLHTSVGTANAVCAVFNAARSRVPILLAAGRTPLFEHTRLGARDFPIHWAQEMFDQAGMLREFVAWDYELRDGAHVTDVVDRAVDVACTEPGGPVYLTLPREVLAAPMPGTGAPPAPARPAPPHPDPGAVARLADLLATASFPVVVTADAGADAHAVVLLDELSRRFGIAVVEQGPRHVNLPADHPLHAGYSVDAVLGEADVLCVLDLDVPWIPGTAAPRADAVVVQCGPDPHFSRYPVRTHRADLSITTTSTALLAGLSAALGTRAVDPGRADRLAARVSGWRARRERVLADEAERTGPITKTALNAALARVRPPGAVVVNEYWASAELLASTTPGTWFGTPPAGGLGWGLPAALGLQMARPEATVIAAVGDGAYLFANPAACHHAMAMHDLPVLTVVCTNGHWGAVQGSTLRMYPDGHTAGGGALSPLAQLGPVPDFAAYAEASGGLGLRVEQRAQLVPALRQALRSVEHDRRPALVDVRCV